MKSAHRTRRLVNWMNLSTMAGLLLARATRCSLQRGPDGLLFAFGYTPGLPAASAFTVGNVILFRKPVTAGPPRPALLAHEARHSTQYAVCLGLPFLPLYFAAAAYSLLRTGDPASLNVFERRAGLADGGYTERPVRPLGVGAKLTALKLKASLSYGSRRARSLATSDASHANTSHASYVPNASDAANASNASNGQVPT